MTSFWTLQKGYDGASFDDVDDLNPSRTYQFRHGDYFNDFNGIRAVTNICIHG